MASGKSKTKLVLDGQVIEHEDECIKFFRVDITVPIDTLDMPLSLGSIARPTMLHVRTINGRGVSYKPGVAGADSIHSVPFSYQSNPDGFDCDQILLTNSGDVEAKVVVIARE